MTSTPRIAMVAGETSGDLLAGLLLDGLRGLWPGLQACGIGGPQMARRGFEAWWPSERLAVHGYSIEVFRRLAGIMAIRRQLRQRLLQDALGVPVPRYLHTPLVLAADGQKLSKQTGARALDTQTPAAALQALSQAAQVLGLSPAVSASIPAALDAWIAQWDRRWHICGDNPRS